MSNTRILGVLMFVGTTACSGHEGSQTTPDSNGSGDTSVSYLTPTEHLSRASLALRGIRPSIEDLKLVDADPSQLSTVVDRYVQSAEFGETIKDLHNESLLLRIEFPLLTPPALAPLASSTFTQMNTVFEEPLELIANIVMNDRPYTEIVTANYTVANDVSSQMWGLAHTPGSKTWDKTQYADGRGAAGILSTSILFQRWRSTGFNFNRGRANLVSRSLLCHDFLKSDIAVDTSVDLSDPNAVANAVVANPSCAGCHQTLDPLASYFFTPDGTHNFTSYPDTTANRLFWDPRRAGQWKATNKRPPMFFGDDTVVDLGGLGTAIAADPRFAQCTAIHFASYMSEVPADQLSGAWIARLQTQFVASGYNAKQLAKAVVLSDEFRVSHATDPTIAEGVVGYLKLRPEQLSRELADLAGYSWSIDSTTRAGSQVVGFVDLLRSDFIGFRVLAGGIDSYFVATSVFTMNATASLVAKLAASAAADYIVDSDAVAAPGARKLFTQAAVTATDEPSVRAELAYLHARIYSELVTPSEPGVDDSYALFTGALAATNGDAVRAWKLTLIGMLCDLRSQYY
ncbi:MAG: hypothetical protein JWO36_3630 [Myxococcales bacterium]|nr:hypothetical protein [Myxococcales bacterium]